jgi:UPF0716 protein FxsA
VFFALLLLFTVVPILEIAILVKLGDWLGFWATLALVLGTGVVGAALARWQGFRAVGRINDQLRQGALPTTAITDGIMILIAGLLLITPGALTDVVGLSLLVPPIREVLRRGAAHLVRKHFHVQHFDQHGQRYGRASGRDDVIDVEVIDVSVAGKAGPETRPDRGQHHSDSPNGAPG